MSSTLKMVKKAANYIAAPQLIGADYQTRGKEFWMFNGPGGHDYKFSYSGHASSLKAYEKCPPLTAIINKKAQAFINGKTWILNKKGKAKEKESTGEIATKIRKLMAQPNPLQSQKEFEAQQYIYCQVFGWCLMISKTPVGFPNYESERLWNIPPSMVDIEETKKNWLLAKERKDVIKKIIIEFEGERVEIDASFCYIIKDFTPSFKSPIFPESRISSLELPVSNIMGAYESRGVLIESRGAMGIISPDSRDGAGIAMPLKEDDKLDLQNEYLQYGLMRKQWKLILSTAAIKYSQIGIPTRELMLFEEVEDSIMRICDGYNFPYPLMASARNNNLGGSNTDPNKTLLYHDGIIPEAESICEQWSNFFELDKYDLIMEKDFSKVPALQEDEKKLAEARQVRNRAYQLEFFANLCTLNEWRIANGDDPLDGDLGTKRYSELAKEGWVFAGVINIENPAMGAAQVGTQGQNDSQNNSSNQTQENDK